MTDISGYLLAGKITEELLNTVKQAPMLESKKLYIYQSLENDFLNFDWRRSFTEKTLIIYDEVLPAEILIHIHGWLRTKCANIENIYLATTHHCGLSQWWKQWCETFHEKSFSIIELTFNRLHYNPTFDFPACPNLDFFTSQKEFHYYFSFYGGTYAKRDQTYFLLKLLPLRQHGVVEYIGNDIDAKTILDYAEYVTYYKNQNKIDTIVDHLEHYFSENKLIDQPLSFVAPTAMPYENFFAGHQWAVDRHCFANVVRETINDQPYACVTEKTTRPFLHHQVVIPACYQAVEILENLGFWFPHDLIDYSYQHEKDYGQRIAGLVNVVQNLIQKFSLQDLQHYYQQNQQKFHHNNQLVYEIYGP